MKIKQRYVMTEVNKIAFMEILIIICVEKAMFKIIE